ncbi:MAG: amidohydrolase family protein [Candidatus Neomarinimicrobiota bacterium]
MIKKIYLLVFSLLLAQTEPVKDIRVNPPRVWALTNAMIHTEPGDSLKDATVIIRDGRIDKVGRYIKIPLDAYEIDLEGAHIYPGFIDGWYEVKKDEKIISPDDHWNKKIRANYRAKDDLKIKEKDLKSLRALGLTAIHIVPQEGIFKGKSDLVMLDNDFTSFKKDVAQIIEFKTTGWSDRSYPNSLLGVIAVIRQTLLDANWYQESIKIVEKYPEGNKLVPFHPSLSQLADFQLNRKPLLFMTKEEHGALRALKIADEFNLTPWLLGSGYEYRRINEIVELNPFIVFPLEFPSKPKVKDPHIALQYSTEQLKHWDMAPDNIKKVFEKGIRFSFTSATLKNKKEFRKNLQKIIDRGLPKSVALSALTTYPAEAMGIEKIMGKIQPGYLANLVVTDGDYFDTKSRVTSLWMNGKEYYVANKHKTVIKGNWELDISGKLYELSFKTSQNKKDDKKVNVPLNKKEKLIGTIQDKNLIANISEIETYDTTIEFKADGSFLNQEGMLAFKGQISKDKIIGKFFDGGTQQSFKAKRGKKGKDKKRTKELKSDTKLFYPEGSYGVGKDLLTPNAILIDNATIWTCGPKGVLQDWDILFVNGKIDKIAPDISVPLGSALTIDGMGKHVTPGLIDCHSHSAASSINEGAQSVTAEVRIQDVLYSDDINIYRQLGGGLTTANILHGSANPIGGQNAVIKLRWGSAPDKLLFKNAPQGIKFALGENVKQANWQGTGRYPQTRMGVEQVIRDAFRAAQDYRHTQKTYERNSKAKKKNTPPRIDLELEALAEILEGKRLLHCHSYRQDEIWMLTRIAEDFGFTIATFQHVLEGYKVAERLAEHGAGASTFSDWWQYKYEVIDAIPYNGTMMAKNNVLVSFNSDDAELARRMNTEAAKAIKYGGLDEIEALHFVTINPAKQLKIEKWVGSLEEEKDADFVIWDGPPLSIYSKVQETWIDGTRYWSVDENAQMEDRDQALRENLIKKILNSTTPNTGKDVKPNGETPNHGHNCDIIDSDLFSGEFLQ